MKILIPRHLRLLVREHEGAVKEGLRSTDVEARIGEKDRTANEWKQGIRDMWTQLIEIYCSLHRPLF